MVWGQKRGVEDLVERLRQDLDPEGASLLVMSTRKFGDEDCQVFCAALGGNSTVEELLASGHTLSAEGTQHFAEALRSNKTLRRLALGNSELGDEAVEALLHDWNNESLLHLDLELKSLGVRSAVACAGVLTGKPHALVELKLGRNSLGDQGVSALCSGLTQSKTLGSVDLQQNDIGVKGCASLGDALRSSTCLESRKELALCLDGNKFQCAGVEALMKGSHEHEINSAMTIAVTWLSVQECGIGSQGARALGKSMTSTGPFDSMRCLQIANNNISDGTWLGSAAARDASCLEKIYMGRNPLGTQGVGNLAVALAGANTSNALRTLDLTGAMRDCSFSGPSELERILAPLAQIGSLEQLYLLGNPIGDAGGLLLVEKLRDSRLKTLSLACVGLSLDGTRVILDALLLNRQLETLELGGNELGEAGNELVDAFRSKMPGLDIAVDMKESPMNGINQADDGDGE